jgi:dTMP kinase
MTKRGHGYPGALFSFTGADGGGKSTHRKLLEEYLTEQKYSVTTCKDPHDAFRELLLNPNEYHLTPKSELLIFMAARSEMVENTTIPALKQGKIVLYEQYTDASKAYQGYGLRLPMLQIDQLNDFVTNYTKPDLTFLFDVDPPTAKISTSEYGEKDKIESRGLEFQNRVREGYLEMAAREPERFVIVPYIENRIETQQQSIRDHANNFIKEHNLKGKLLRNA